jgi:pyruvate,orthophosphate dikinase
MNLVGIPVPPGFTLTTEVCNLNNQKGKAEVFQLIKTQVEDAVRYLEEIMGTEFGNPENPLLLSVRSGARTSMPGMMDTVLNLGLNEKSVEGMAKKWGKTRFAWDSYRRLLQMYGNVVMELKPDSKEEEDPFEMVIDELKKEKGVENDTDLTASDLKELSRRFKKLIKNKTGKNFPDDPWEQLWGAVFAVFESWNNERAQVYRKLNNIPNHWGTAVNVQAMVYGNLSENCATGVAFTRDAATGEDIFNGEFLFNAQGEDVVAGIRTPQQITLEGSRRWAELVNISEENRAKNFPSLEESMPEIYAKLSEYETRLENHYKDMQDLEFTIQEGKLWILQTRNGKRTGMAAVNIAVEMLDSGMIDEKAALMRVDPVRLDDLLHPVFKKSALNKTDVITQGLPASPGAATGQIVFFADDAEEWAENGKETILIRIETSPEDLRGMSVSNGILTARGGMTSHAAVVARGMGKCCVSGAGAIHVDYKLRTMTVGDRTFKEGDWISLNGSTGEVYEGKIETELPELSGNFGRLMSLSDKYTKLKVRTNADSPEDAEVARNFGAQGIGLCRTEHMFFTGDRILAIREMILADDEKGRRKALAKLLPIQRADFEGIFESMHDLPVTVRLLDPPLHEFLPHSLESQEEMAEKMGVPLTQIQEKIDSLDETNPMLGHRGCRLGITYPEITEMQTRAIIEAALNNKKRGIHVCVELMVPLIGRSKEFIQQEMIIRTTAEKIFEECGDRIEYRVGTMIEIPRAALTADLIAKHAEFFSFGTNDLTQMTFGFSRDDIGKFLPIYLEKGIMEFDPFKRIDENGVGKLVEFAVKNGRKTRPNIKLGICGEHGGNPESIDFCHRIGLEYVSCSPYRVPIARLAAAQVNIRNS